MSQNNELVLKPIFVDGEWVTSRVANTRVVTNPTTRDPLARISECGAADIDVAVAAAKRAQVQWAKVTGPEKAALLHGIARKTRERAKEIGRLMTLETGKPLIESYDELEWVAACFDYYAEIGRQSRGNSAPPVLPNQLDFTVKEPVGVVAAIVPFNFPLLLLAWKAAPALAAGCTLVCKPPHQNPLSTLLFAEVLSDLPRGVIHFITGAAETGDLLVRHRDINLIAFTGSSVVGRRIASVAGEHLKRVNLELGGIDPMIVFEDADIDVAVRGAAWARFVNCGQVCTSAKRLYVVDKIYDKFKEALLNYVKTVKVGDPLDPTTDMGPLITEEALLRVEKQIAKTVQEGSTVLAGGKPKTVANLKGFFFEPTVVEAKHGSLPTREEVFGPVITLIRAKDGAQAIEYANDSEYGLGASVFTKSLDHAFTASEQIKAGMFWVNDPLTDNDACPFGGVRASGLGRELGEEGLDAFREVKHVHLDWKHAVKPYWFPYADRK